MDNFNNAINRAIQESKSTFENLRKKINSGLSRLNQATNTLQPWTANASSQNVAEQFISLVQEADPKIRELYDRQQQSLSTFKIVLFGRTGVGKSTLIEAFVRGNGNTVSLGDSDWTTQVSPKKWNSCIFIDTPGIGGWGRTESREDLENKAHHAVETADLVLLCFDSQNHTAYEFKQVAEWIKEYGKPTIVVFNVRNQRWRIPDKVSTVSKRQNLSLAVQQQTNSIRDELRQIDLFDVPIIALSSQLALCARITPPFDGPYKKSYLNTLNKYRSEYGIKTLENWSNFPALEELIIEAINSDATELRLGMLREQTCGVLRSLKKELCKLQQQVQADFIPVENYIKRNLEIVGYPQPQSRSLFRHELGSNVDLLTKLEQLRKEPFQAPIQGQFQSYTQRLLSTALEQLRSESHNKAEAVVSDAFDKSEQLTKVDFQRRVFDENNIQQTINQILQEAVKFLEQKLELERRETEVDVRYTLYTTQVDGQSDTHWKWIVPKSISLLGSVAATLGGLALTNFWNPFGWATGVAAAMALFGGIVSSVFGWLNEKQRKEAEETRLSERRKALSQVRQSVDTTYDDLKNKIIEQINPISQEAAVTRLDPLLRDAIALRLVQNETKSTGIYLQRIIDEINKILVGTPAQELLSRATQLVEQKRRTSKANLWLGEDWILETGESMDRTVKPSSFTFPQQPFQKRFSRLTANANRLQPGTAAQWLTQIRQLLTPAEDEISRLLNELSTLLQDGQARFHLYGDWNTGKTSFIKRLLIDAGLDIPSSLEVRAHPTTTTVQEYRWNGILLVDNPGFQNTRTQDSNVALESFPDASVILYLFSPKLVTGDTNAIDLILKGNKEQGILSKLARTFFIINCCDELVVDPIDTPEEYLNLCKGKKEELVLILKSRGIDINTEQVFCMSSDPYQVGNDQDVKSSDFDPYRDWDGFDSFVTAFNSVRSEIQTIGIEWSVLEGGVARFSNLITTATEAEKDLHSKEESINHLCQILSKAIQEANMIEADIKAKLRRLVDDHTAALIQNTLAAIEEAEIQAQAKRLSQWWTDEAFSYQLTQWWKEAYETINDWVQNSQSLVGRSIASEEFQHALPNFGQPFDELNNLIPPEQTWITNISNLINSIVKIITPFADDIAIGIAQRISFLPLLGFVFEIVSTISGVQQTQKREEARKQLADRIKESADNFCRALLEDDRKNNQPEVSFFLQFRNLLNPQQQRAQNSISPISYLRNTKHSINTILDKLQAERQQFEDERKDQTARKQKYEYCKNTALNLLG